MGIRDRGYMRRPADESPSEDWRGDDGLPARAGRWVKILLALLGLALIAVAVANNV